MFVVYLWWQVGPFCFAFALTRHSNHLLVRDQVQLIEDRIVLRQVLVAALLLLAAEYRAVDCLRLNQMLAD